MSKFNDGLIDGQKYEIEFIPNIEYDFDKGAVVFHSEEFQMTTIEVEYVGYDCSNDELIFTILHNNNEIRLDDDLIKTCNPL